MPGVESKNATCWNMHKSWNYWRDKNIGESSVSKYFHLIGIQVEFLRDCEGRTYGVEETFVPIMVRNINLGDHISLATWSSINLISCHFSHHRHALRFNSPLLFIFSFIFVSFSFNSFSLSTPSMDPIGNVGCGINLDCRLTFNSKWNINDHHNPQWITSGLEGS